MDRQFAPACLYLSIHQPPDSCGTGTVVHHLHSTTGSHLVVGAITLLHAVQVFAVCIDLFTHFPNVGDTLLNEILSLLSESICQVYPNHVLWKHCMTS